jgi:hypothetical protein
MQKDILWWKDDFIQMEWPMIKSTLQVAAISREFKYPLSGKESPGPITLYELLAFIGRRAISQIGGGVKSQYGLR